MPNTMQIRCPFYITMSRHRPAITCEAIHNSKNMDVSLEFKASQDASAGENRKKWIENYCSKYGYKNCPYAKDLLKKYEGEQHEEENKYER